MRRLFLLASVVAVAAALMAVTSGAALAQQITLPTGADLCASGWGATVVGGGTSTCFADPTSQAVAFNGSDAEAAGGSQAVALNDSLAIANNDSQAVAFNDSEALATFNCVATALNGETDTCP